ncbi:hypothetical protein GC209_19270 [bacterium]|nr:hypothetical protein [bacterium]
MGHGRAFLLILPVFAPSRVSRAAAPAATWSARDGGLVAAAGGAPGDGAPLALWQGNGSAVDLAESDAGLQAVADASLFAGLTVSRFSGGRRLVSASALAGQTGGLMLVLKVASMTTGSRTVFAIPDAGGNAAVKLVLRSTTGSDLFADLVLATDGGDETVTLDLSALPSGAAVALLGTSNRASKSLSLTADDGTPATATYAGTATDEAGAAIVGCGLAADGEDSGVGSVGLALLERLDHVPSTSETNALWAAAAAELAPVAPATVQTVALIVETDNTVTAAALAADPAGYGLEAAAVGSVPDGIDVEVSGSDFSVTPHTEVPLGVAVVVASLGPLGSTVAIGWIAFAGSGAVVWPNGFARRFDVSVPAASLAGMSADLAMPLVWIWLDDPDLATVANGGVVTDAGGGDIRLELALGSKVAHRLAYYDGAAGQAWLVCRPGPLLTSGLPLYAFAGNSGATAEEDPAGVRLSDLACLADLLSGTDLTGSGNDLAVTGFSTAAGLLVPCGQAADTAGDITDADGSWADGATALTLAAFVRPDDAADDYGIACIGSTASDAAACVSLRVDKDGVHGGAARTVCTQFAVAGSYSDRIEGESDAAPQGRWALPAWSWQSGQADQATVDGVSVGKTNTGDVATNLTGALAGGVPHFCRAGNNKGLKGKAQLGFGWLRAVGNEELAVLSANLRFPLAFHARSAAASYDDAAQLVATPIWATMEPNGTLYLDPVSVGAGDGDLVVSVPTASMGTVSIVDNQIKLVAPAAEADVLVSYTLSDKRASVTGYCQVTVAGSTVAPAEAKPWDGVLYGCPVQGDTVAPTQIKAGAGIRNFYTFTAERTCLITGVRQILRACLSTAEVHDSPGDYSSGNGGTITLQIRPLNADGSPSSTILGRTRVNNGFGTLCTNAVTNGFNQYAVWDFLSPVPVTRGQRYCFYFENTGGAKDWISLDYTICYANVPTGLNPPQHCGIFYGDQNLCYGRYVYGSGPDARSNMGGMWDVKTADGLDWGNPYYFAKSNARKTVGGSLQARQKFTVSDYTRIVDALWFRCWWTSAKTTDLIIRLENTGGSPIEQISVPRANIVATNAYPGNPYARWVKVGFAAPRTLSLGQTYYLRFSAAAGGYEFCPQYLYGAATSRNSWPNAYCQYSTNGGSSWIDGWDRDDQPGNYLKGLCLSAAFAVSG